MVSLHDLKGTYKGKKVFMTGHTGFKGSWMLKTLSLLGAEVKGYALDPHTPNDLYCLIEGNELCQSVIGDVRDKSKLGSEILAFQPDFIFHMAAQPLVRLSYQIPEDTFEVNALGTANVLNGVKLLKKKCTVVLITTDKVYHNNEWEYPYRENDRLGGYDPYSASKACAELIVDSYRNSFFNGNFYEHHLKGIAVARAGNVIGGGDWSIDRLIPDTVRSLIANRPVVIRNPKSVRPWQHVLEPILGYLILGMHLERDPITFGQAFNFGPQSDEAISVEEMLKLAFEAWGNGEWILEHQVNRPHEAGLLKLDISKAKSELGWVPILKANESISITLSWYKYFVSNRNEISEFTNSQILNFLYSK
jgi:CDP-glucose 4,6-dehydratase